MHAVDGHCMPSQLAIAGGQSSGEIKSRVDGHPISLRDRVLMKKFSVSPLMEEPQSRESR